jgi:hypothetical protein
VEQADLIIYGTLVVLALLLGVLIWWGVRVRRLDDQKSRLLTVDEVRDLTAADRVGDRFLWCVWQDRLSASAFKLHVRDETGAELTVATKYLVPLDGVRMRYTLQGQGRRCVRGKLLSNRSFLLPDDSATPLMACAHETLRLTLLGSDLETERCRVGGLSLRTEERTITQEDRDVGKLFMVKTLKYHVLILSLLPDVLTLEEQLFLLLDGGGD